MQMRCRRLLVLSAVLCGAINAQWLNFHVPGTPRLKDGTPNLGAPAPRAADGKPDLSGVWLHEHTSLAEMKRLFGDITDARERVNVVGMEADSISKYALDLLVDFRPDDKALLRPEEVELQKKNAANGDPSIVCEGGSGIPRAGLLSEPFKILQSPRLTAILYEGNPNRQIYTDGRELPKEYSLPAYMGYSVGKWERDTLVVESAGFNSKTTLDMAGHVHSEDLRTTERFRRRDFGHLQIETTFKDPKMYTRPFTVTIGYVLLADDDIFESICTENEKDRDHMKKK
jgi:hypothetical protein